MGEITTIALAILAVLGVIVGLVGRVWFGIDKTTKARILDDARIIAARDVRIRELELSVAKAEAEADGERDKRIDAEQAAADHKAEMTGLRGEIAALTAQVARLELRIAGMDGVSHGH